MMHNDTCDATRPQIAFNTAVAVTITSLLWLPLAHADDRPSGIPDEAKHVKVDRVTDGDTIVLMDATRVRLPGIDTPERDQPYGPAATTALEGMVETSVYIVEVDTDRYGRMVGQLYHSKEGYNINASLVCAGFAWWYEKCCSQQPSVTSRQTDPEPCAEAGLSVLAALPFALAGFAQARVLLPVETSVALEETQSVGL